MGVVVKHINNPLPRPKKIVSNIPKSVEGVLVEALEKKPDNRYQNIEIFAKILENLRRGEKVK